MLLKVLRINTFNSYYFFLEVFMLDLLRPVIGRNRKEIIIIQYEGFMQNIIEALILRLKHMRQILADKYPELSKYFDMNEHDLYDSTKNISNLDIFLRNINCDGILENEDIKNHCFDIDINPIRMDTLFEIAISNIAAQDFVESIHIVKDKPYSQYDIQYMREVVFRTCKNKISYYEGDICEVCLDLSHILTSVFLNDPNSLFKIYGGIPDNRKPLTMFFLRENELCDNYNFDILLDNKINFTKIAVGSSDVVKSDDDHPMG